MSGATDANSRDGDLAILYRVGVRPAGGGSGLSTVRSASYYIGLPQQMTRKYLKIVGADLSDYKKRNGSLPASLDALQSLSSDGWGHPLVYFVRSGKAHVISYGADGAAGGTGIDSDLSLDNPKPPGSEPTNWQIYSHPSAFPMEVVAFLCGAGVFAWVFASVRWSPRN